MSKKLRVEIYKVTPAAFNYLKFDLLDNPIGATVAWLISVCC